MSQKYPDQSANQEIRVPCNAPNQGPGHRGWQSRGYLPHFDGTVTQAVTLHLGDSLPEEALAKMRTQLELLPEEERSDERRRLIEEYADAGYGCCILRNSEIARMVQNSLLHFHAQRYMLRAWVIMHNHLHVLFRPLHEWTLHKIVASWKKYTARRICDYASARNLRIANLQICHGATANREICVPCVPRPVWHAEFWDRYMRDELHFNQSRSYIHRNPVKAGLVKRAEDWQWSSASPENAAFLSTT